MSAQTQGVDDERVRRFIVASDGFTVANGQMTEGFAFVAYPADYRSSGVVTFIVGPDGVVYEKDLGKKTDAHAKAMKEYNPNSSWQKAEEQQDEIAGVQKTQVK